MLLRFFYFKFSIYLEVKIYLVLLRNGVLNCIMKFFLFDNENVLILKIKFFFFNFIKIECLLIEEM